MHNIDTATKNRMASMLKIRPNLSSQLSSLIPKFPAPDINFINSNKKLFKEKNLEILESNISIFPCSPPSNNYLDDFKY